LEEIEMSKQDRQGSRTPADVERKLGRTTSELEESYKKQSDQISDFLTFLGAPVAAMGIMEARLEKELNNKVNRRCNCDEANTSKVVEAAQEQLAAIRVLRERGTLEQLPQKLLQAAAAREENPSASLTELAAMMEPPITKPAMNHRLKKLVAMAKEV
jgi:DNA-binding protein WhiA